MALVSRLAENPNSIFCDRHKGPRQQMDGWFCVSRKSPAERQKLRNRRKPVRGYQTARSPTRLSLPNPIIPPLRTATRHLAHSKSSLARWTRSVAALPSTLHSNSGGSLGRALRRFRPGVRTLRLCGLALKSFLRLTPGWLSSKVEKVPARISGIFFKRSVTHLNSPRILPSITNNLRPGLIMTL